MRYVLFLFCVACGSATSEAPVSPPTAEAPAAKGTRSDATVDAFAAALKSGAPVFDVRTPQEFAQGHVPGAINLPLGFKTSDPALASVDRDAEVYLICQSGGRSGRAADQLAAAGFNAVNVKGGTSGWAAAGHEVQK